MTTHELKCWPEFFLRILTGEKTFEARKDDRGFRGGDMLRIREWKRDGEVYTGREVTVEVTYLLAGPMFGVQPGWAVMGFTPPALTLARVEAERERDEARAELKGACIIVAQLVWRLGGDIELPFGESIRFEGTLESTKTPDRGLRLRYVAPARAALGAEPDPATPGSPPATPKGEP